jgi:hypothetical protein
MNIRPYSGTREEIPMIEFRVHDMDELAHRVAVEGIDAHPAAVIELAHAAHDLGVAQVLIDVLVDPAEPEAARLRAFGRIASALSAVTPSGRSAPMLAANENDGAEIPVGITAAACC